jgi:hypothetical protein
MGERQVFVTIDPKILYFGTLVILISTLNEDGTANLAPMSSAWALGWTVMLGLGVEGKTIENLAHRRMCAQLSIRHARPGGGAPSSADRQVSCARA